MKKTFSLFMLLITLTMLFAQCGGNSSENATAPNATSTDDENSESDADIYDPKRGEGQFSAENVKPGGRLDGVAADAGEKNYGVKCSSCHKLTDEKLVGPGWKGVTTRRAAYWIMNFITNPDPMINKDPAVQAQLELCLVRMPNQNLNEEEARQLYEYMRKNDGLN
jgi:hypothetical protein